MLDASSGWMPAPSHQPPRSTSNTATAGLYDPRVEIDAAAPRRTVPFARAGVFGDIDVAVCKAVPMMMAPPPAQAQCQVQYNNDEEGAGGDALPLSENQNDDVPGWSRKNYKFIISGLVLVATAAIVIAVLKKPTAVVIAIHQARPSPPARSARQARQCLGMYQTSQEKQPVK